MPFTLAHPIAIAPLWYASRRRLDLPALIVGAMVPDIAYFVVLRPVANIGHSPLGIVVQGIPAGLLLLALIQGVMRRPLVLLMRALLPRTMVLYGPRLHPYRFWPLQRGLVIGVSLALGAGSHIVWDAFTHGDGWVVMRWSGLRAEAWGLPVYKLLQYGGGVLGLVALALWAVWAVAQRSPNLSSSPSSSVAMAVDDIPRGVQIMSLLGMIVCSIVFALWAMSLKQPLILSQMVVQAVIGLVTGGFLGLLGCSLALRLWLKCWD